jgi:hypothetical protein
VLQRGGEHRTQVVLVVDDEQVGALHDASMSAHPGSWL